MLKAVVFDMDSTLLHINLNAFIAILAKDESELLAQVGRTGRAATLSAFYRALWAVNYGEGIEQAEAADDPRSQRTLCRVFDDAFEAGCGIPLSDPVIADVLACYEHEVLPQRNGPLVGARPAQGAREALDCVRSRGLRVALFTNPSFREAAIRCRMGWAGIADEPFELVTFMENSTYCKPTPGYYLEALGKLGLAPEEVLMVGNDPKRDIPDPECGLQTAYVGRGNPVRATWCGPMADFAASFSEIEENFYIRAELMATDGRG